tara:strand:- start:146 stop:1075 length:930 start_codon:yes stop_codon:yes gene_type:complete
MVRRTFIQNTSLSIAGIAVSKFHFNKMRKFRVSLNPGAIGVKTDAKQLLSHAIYYGFEAIVPNASELAIMDKSVMHEYLSKMEKENITFGSLGLPVDFRKDSDTFKKGLIELTDMCSSLRDAGVKRMSTWIMPTHNSLTYLENMKQQSSRLKMIANILGHFGIRFGLEYVGPKTLLARDKYPFVSSLKECKELVSAIDESNVGFVLDSFHWYCAEEGVSDLLTLDNKDIITVDLNDAVSGRDIYSQLDWERMLPGDSGVIDLKGFVNALKTLGYDGPVRAEPFNKVLNEMNDNDALKRTYNAMKKAVDL